MSTPKAKTARRICSAPPAASPNSTGSCKVYEEGKDQKDEDDDELKNKLPVVMAGETLKFKSIDPEQHFTEPPPRFTEATLVKELEADGVGRPSTYASIFRPFRNANTFARRAASSSRPSSAWS